MPDALWLLFAALLIGCGWLAFEFLRAPLIPASPTFDERAATAAAVLQPDAPTLPEPMPFAEQVEMWLELHTAKES